MRCPKCQKGDTRVVESRDSGEDTSVRRRRECLKCAYRFTTYERVEVPYLVVIKKDRSKVPYDRMKIATGIQKAVEKRPVSPAQVERLVDNVERAVFEIAKNNEIPSRDIGELVMEHLLALDDVAYVRFASVYRSFADVDSFSKELAKIKKARHA